MLPRKYLLQGARILELKSAEILTASGLEGARLKSLLVFSITLLGIKPIPAQESNDSASPDRGQAKLLQTQTEQGVQALEKLQEYCQ